MVYLVLYCIVLYGISYLKVVVSLLCKLGDGDVQFVVSLTALLGQGRYHVSVMRHRSDQLTVLGLHQLHHLHYQIIQVKRSGITSKNTIDL